MSKTARGRILLSCAVMRKWAAVYAWPKARSSRWKSCRFRERVTNESGFGNFSARKQFRFGVRDDIALHRGATRELMSLDLCQAEDVSNFVATDGKGVGNELAVATPENRFGAAVDGSLFV